MMLALRDWQADFVAQLASGEGDGRLAIHRHHIARSLGRVLAGTFPTVKTLVGEDFFRQTAEAFVARHLPTQPVLAEYGAGFPDFLAAEEPRHRLPYLADVAHLDWALNVAFHSARMPAGDLRGVGPETVLKFTPGAATLRSPYPIDRIWAASQADAPEGEVDLGEGATCLLVLPTGFIRLEAGEAAFAAAIAEGRSLEAAAAAGFAVESGFDLSACFARLLACEAFAAMQQESAINSM